MTRGSPPCGFLLEQAIAHATSPFFLAHNEERRQSRKSVINRVRWTIRQNDRSSSLFTSLQSLFSFGLISQYAFKVFNCIHLIKCGLKLKGSVEKDTGGRASLFAERRGRIARVSECRAAVLVGPRAQCVHLSAISSLCRTASPLVLPTHTLSVCFCVTVYYHRQSTYAYRQVRTSPRSRIFLLPAKALCANQSLLF